MQAQIILNQKYRVTKEFLPLVGITINQWNRRKKEILDWLENFYEYEYKEGRPATITITKIYADYQPLPYRYKYTKEEKIRDYEKYVKDHLPREWELLTKKKMAEDSIKDFSREKYGHYSPESVVKGYVSPAMEKFGEKTRDTFWVHRNEGKYILCTEEEIAALKELFSKYNISEKQQADAFKKYADGENIDKEVSWYKAAIGEFESTYGFIPFKISKWKLKDKVYTSADLVEEYQAFRVGYLEGEISKEEWLDFTLNYGVD